MGTVGCSGCLSPRSQRAARTSPLSWGQFSPGCSSPGVGVGTGHRGMGRLAARVPSPPTLTQISQDTWLVAEIPFISLNCVTSNTAGGRISVDLSYWGWRVQNLAEKIYHARKIIAVVSAIYRREGQRRSVPSLPASRTPCSAERRRHRGENPVGYPRGQGDAHPLCGVRTCAHRAMAARTMTGTSPFNP